MSKLVHALLQTLGVAVVIGTDSLSSVPTKYQALVTGLVAVGQAGLALYNHTTPSTTTTVAK
jgi:hypothetical protein